MGFGKSAVNNYIFHLLEEMEKLGLDSSELYNEISNQQDKNDISFQDVEKYEERIALIKGRDNQINKIIGND
jgi:hypothetical protein